jgi:hypothetical protein
MNNIRTTLMDALDSINHHRMGLVTDEGLTAALHALKAAVHPDPDALVRNINEKQVNLGNKLIAEFMNVPVHPNKRYWIEMPGAPREEGWYSLCDLEYHRSWSWLMPVVTACFEIFDIQDGTTDSIKLNNALVERNPKALHKVVVELLTRETS